MARYAVGPGGHYRKGKLYHEGDIVVLADDEEPHPEWTRMDAVESGQKSDEKAEPEPDEKGTMLERAKKDSAFKRRP